MRVTDRSNARLLMQALQQLKTRQNHYLGEMASGKSINRPSDNPVDESRAARLKASIEKLSRYQKTYTNMKTTLSMYDSILNEVTTSLQAAFQRGSEAANSTSSADERQIIATELSQIRALELSHEQHSLALTRDLFIIGAYSGLRVSDYNRLTNDNLHTHNGSEMLEVRCQLFTSIDKSSYGRYLWSFRSCYISTICYP